MYQTRSLLCPALALLRNEALDGLPAPAGCDHGSILSSKYRPYAFFTWYPFLRQGLNRRFRWQGLRRARSGCHELICYQLFMTVKAVIPFSRRLEAGDRSLQYTPHKVPGHTLRTQLQRSRGLTTQGFQATSHLNVGTLSPSRYNH